MSKPVQYLSDEYVARCRQASTAQILAFLEEYRLLQAGPSKTRLISIKIPEHLLSAFRSKCELQGIKYQTCIKKLMDGWVKGSE